MVYEQVVVALLTGGDGSEREISLATAETIRGSLDRLGIAYNVFDLRDKDWLTQVKNYSPDVAVIAVHGTFGEDGGLQIILEENTIRHTGCTADVAKLTFDKKRTKMSVAKIGIPIAEEYSVKNTITLPVVVKPNSEGSSVGVAIVHTQDELTTAIKNAETYGDVLIEQYISGRELTCGVTNLYDGVHALPIVEIKPTAEFFDFKSKYAVGGSEEICPANLDEATTQKIFELSEKIFTHLRIGQYCRIDWILHEDIPYFLEVNTIPGMTKTSLINKEISAAQIRFDDFISKLITSA
jgi:D-alanine-D-alanine ligase